MNKLKIVPFFARLCDLVLRYMIWEGAKCNILHVLYCELFIFSFIAACHLVGVQEILTSGRIKLRNNKTIENEKDVYHDYIIKIFRAKCFLVEGSLLGAIPVYMTACVCLCLEEPSSDKDNTEDRECCSLWPSSSSASVWRLPLPLPLSATAQTDRRYSDLYSLLYSGRQRSIWLPRILMKISLLIFSSLDEGTFSKVPSPNVVFDIENPSSYRRKPSWYMRFRHRNK